MDTIKLEDLRAAIETRPGEEFELGYVKANGEQVVIRARVGQDRAPLAPNQRGEGNMLVYDLEKGRPSQIKLDNVRWLARLGVRRAVEKGERS